MSTSHTPSDGRRGTTPAAGQCFPLQRRCMLRDAPDQAEFAREASAVISPGEMASLEATAGGLLLLAENQVAHGRLLGLVQAVYGNMVDFGPLEIRYRYEDGVRMEPHMALRVKCRAERLDAVLADLRGREACVLEQRCEGASVVLRATAPLALLLGYPVLLRRLDVDATLTASLAFYARTGAQPPTTSR